MSKEKEPLLSDEFLKDLAEEINAQFGFKDVVSQNDLDTEETD